MKRVLEFGAAILIAGGFTRILIACVIYRAIENREDRETQVRTRALELARKTPFSIEDAEAIVRFSNANDLDPNRVADSVAAGTISIPDEFFRRPR